MVQRRSIFLASSIAVLAWGTMHPVPASAFACYVGEVREGFVLLRDRPTDTAKVIAQLESSNMVGDVSGVRERNGWVYVRWSRTQSSQAEFRRGKGNGKGWMKRDDIRGECED